TCGSSGRDTARAPRTATARCSGRAPSSSAEARVAAGGRGNAQSRGARTAAELHAPRPDVLAGAGLPEARPRRVLPAPRARRPAAHPRPAVHAEAALHGSARPLRVGEGRAPGAAGVGAPVPAAGEVTRR